MSTRFGSSNKLLVHVGGVAIVERTARAYLESGLDPILVVVGHDAANIQRVLAGLPLRCIENTEYQLGQSRALFHGISALPAGIDAAVIGVADQPLLSRSIIRSLADRYLHHRPPIVAPRFAGRNGNPVLFDRELFRELLQVVGDQGGRGVMKRHRREVVWVEFEDERVGCDVDTPDDLEELRRDSTR